MLCDFLFWQLLARNATIKDLLNCHWAGYRTGKREAILWLAPKFNLSRVLKSDQPLWMIFIVHSCNDISLFYPSNVHSESTYQINLMFLLRFIIDTRYFIRKILFHLSIISYFRSVQYVFYRFDVSKSNLLSRRYSGRGEQTCYSLHVQWDT